MKAFTGILDGPRDYVVYCEFPDGLNFMHGIVENKLPPNKEGLQAIYGNLWTIHFSDLVEGGGLFTRDEALFYAKMADTEGVQILRRRKMERLISNFKN
jgi:hypothetical protein